MKSFAVCMYFFLPLIVIQLAPASSAAFTQFEPPREQPKFIIIHLDGISSDFFREEMQKGRLPAIAAYFDDANIVDHAITYFPSKTPTVITSIRESVQPEQSEVPGWEYRDAEEHSLIHMSTSFFRMAFSTSRISLTNLIYGTPGLHWLAGIALQNTADFLQDYPVLQFYWFPTDTQGHFNGLEALRREMHRFDRQFGKLVKRLGHEDVNIIIYSDHGMAFGEGHRPEAGIEELIGSDLEFFSYPAIYLNQGVNPEDYAEKLLYDIGFDFVFYADETGNVKGIHEHGEILFVISGSNIKYEYSGDDVLGYSELGYHGGYLSTDEWLKLTHQSRYPAAPANIIQYLNNPRTGELIVLYDEGKYYQTGYSKEGNHGGFIHHEMSVPLLLKGPEVARFEHQEYFWLPDLFREIGDLNFNAKPDREKHRLKTSVHVLDGSVSTELEISPTYRVAYGVASFHDEYFRQFQNNFTVWGKFDVHRSYISRFWVGAGIAVENEQKKPVFLFQYDINYRRWSLESRLFTTQNVTFSLGYQLTGWLRLETENFKTAGIRFTI